MEEISERDSIIINLKNQLFDSQQRLKNISNLEKTNMQFQTENSLLFEEKMKLEYTLKQTKETLNKQILDLNNEITTLNNELNVKKQLNVKLFNEIEALKNNNNKFSQENIKLLQTVNYLLNQPKPQNDLEAIFTNEIKLMSENFQNKCQNIKNYYEQEIKKLNWQINNMIIEINKLKQEISQLYSDNKILVKIYKHSVNKKEIDYNVINLLINNKLLPKNFYNNNYNNNRQNSFSKFGYDINKIYDFKNMVAEKKIIKPSRSTNNFENSKTNNKTNNIRDKSFLNEKYITNIQNENLKLKKQVINLSVQNEKIIQEIESIVKISGFSTIDITTEGIKHLQQIIFTNKELLEKFLCEINEKS